MTNFPYPSPSITALAPDVYKGACQGLDADDFNEYVPVLLRSCSAEWSVAGTISPDDWQRILIFRRKGDQLPGGPGVIAPPLGAYIRYAGNTWLVRKSKTMHAVPGGALVSRCNASALLTDAAGEQHEILLSVGSAASDVAPSVEEYGIYPGHRLTAVCQYNSTTALITEGTRLLIENQSYTCRGVNNILRSVSLDPSSTHIMYFSIERSI